MYLQLPLESILPLMYLQLPLESILPLMYLHLVLCWVYRLIACMSMGRPGQVRLIHTQERTCMGFCLPISCAWLPVKGLISNSILL